MKRLIYCLFLLGSTLGLSAQTTADALRFSQFGVGGTARTVAVGGAIGALGGDFSVISTNPAGLGIYQGSEFTMTPSFYLSSVDAQLEDGGQGAFAEDNTNFNFNNIGIVFGKKVVSSRSKWRTSNFSIGINRLANFNEKISYEGATPGSYVDFFQEQATGLLPEEFNDFDTGLAWDVGAIYDLELDRFYETDIELVPGAPIQKNQTISRSGSINEVVFGVGGYRGEKLMLGMTLGFPIVSFTERSNYTESDRDDLVPLYNNLAYTQELETRGFGLNLKVGAIYVLSDMIRLGASVHTPTRLRLTDDYQTSLVYDFTDEGTGNDGALESSSPESTFDYDLKTPWRFIGSGALLIKKMGFISAEVEYINYSGASFKEPRTEDGLSVNTGFFNDLNQDVSDEFNSVLLLRVGGEYALKKLRFRAGVNLGTTPYADETGITDPEYSAGIGFREKKFFIDATYTLRTANEGFSPYSSSISQQFVNLDDQKNRALLTLGFRF